MPSNPKLLTRVQQLIALSASSAEEEARTAAFQACKLIRENKLEIVTSAETPAPAPPKPARAAAPPPPPPPPKPQPTVTVSDKAYRAYTYVDTETARRKAKIDADFLDDFFETLRKQAGAWDASARRDPGPERPFRTDYEDGYPFRQAAPGFSRDPPFATKQEADRYARDKETAAKAKKPTPKTVLNSWVVERGWTLAKIKFKGGMKCSNCREQMDEGVEAWHSKYEIRCRACSVGPVGDAFNKQP